MFLDSPMDRSITVHDDMRKIILQRIDEAINQAQTVDEALLVVEQLVVISELSGLGLAKSLYEIKKKFNVDEDYIYERVGKHKTTVQNYIRIWKMFAEKLIPDEYMEAIQSRNIKDLVPIANALEQGYEFTDSIWEDIAQAPNFNTVSKVVREKVKGEEGRTNLLTIMLKSNGDIIGYKNGEQYFGGHLVMDNQEVITQIRERIIKGAGVLQ